MKVYINNPGSPATQIDAPNGIIMEVEGKQFYVQFGGEGITIAKEATSGLPREIKITPFVTNKISID